MKFKEWRSLWRIDRDIDVPHASIVIMTPYGFVRVLWHYCRQEFYETGIVYGWRWPWQKTFRERARIKARADGTLAVYTAMDQIYLARATEAFGLDPAVSIFSPERFFATKAAQTLKLINESAPCPHDKPGQPRYWIASCENCARKALLAAIEIRGEYDGRKQTLSAHESQRRTAEIAERLTAHRRALVEAGKLGIPDPNKALGAGQ